MKINKVNLLIFFLFILSVFFLITEKIIYPSIIPNLVDGEIYLFSDWSVIVNANWCDEKGLDVYLENPCDPWGRRHVYGKSLLYLPFVADLKNFYFFYLPIILNLIFSYIVINFFQFKNRLEYFTIIPFIFAPCVLMVIERTNIDLIIFLTVFIISRNKKIIINSIIIVLVAVSKFYPISLVIVFLYEKNLKKLFFNLIFFFVALVSLLYFQYEDMIKIFNNKITFTPGGLYNFSFNGLVLSAMEVNYLFIFICLATSIFLIIKLKIKFFLKNEKIHNLLITNIYENRLYVSSSIIIVSCYFIFPNTIYREIFFLGLIPWIIVEKQIGFKAKFINFYYYLLFTKFMVSGIVIYVLMNGYLLNARHIFLFIKNYIDFNLILLMSLILLSSFKFLLLKLKKDYVPQ